MGRNVLLVLLATLGLQPAVKAEESPTVLIGLVKSGLPQMPVGLRGMMSGDAQVVLAFTVNANGQVVDCVALEATRSEFAEAATAAVMEWQFAAATAGNPMPRREVVEFAFRRNGVVTTLQHIEAARESFNLTTRYSDIETVKITELDAPLQRLSAPMPAVSSAQLDMHGKQPLIVNFVVDTAGNVRVPVVTVADPQLAQPVLDAVKQWRYAPPTRNGTPVLVEVTRAMRLPGVVNDTL